jgi:hypothetical protein
MGAASAAAAVALRVGAPQAIVPVALAGAAITAAIRALVGDSPASLTGAVIAPLLMIASLFDPGLGHGHGIELVRACVAIAAAAWTVVELARPTSSPLVAVLPAAIASILDPSFVALVAIAGARLMTAPWQRPRWVVAVPILGGLAVVLAVIAGTAHGGSLAALGDRWCGAPAHRIAAGSLATLAGDVVGPLTAVAALAGLAVLARLRHAEIAIAACVAGAILVDLRAGAIGPSLIAIAALCAGLAVGRVAGLIRLASGQAIVGAAVGVLLVVPPAWTAIERGPRVAIEHASR